MWADDNGNQKNIIFKIFLKTMFFRETPGADDVYSAWFFDLAGSLNT